MKVTLLIRPRQEYSPSKCLKILHIALQCAQLDVALCENLASLASQTLDNKMNNSALCKGRSFCFAQQPTAGRCEPFWFAQTSSSRRELFWFAQTFHLCANLFMSRKHFYVLKYAYIMIMYYIIMNTVICKSFQVLTAGCLTVIALLP